MGTCPKRFSTRVSLGSNHNIPWTCSRSIISQSHRSAIVYFSILLVYVSPFAFTTASRTRALDQLTLLLPTFILPALTAYRYTNPFCWTLAHSSTPRKAENSSVSVPNRENVTRRITAEPVMKTTLPAVSQFEGNI